MTLFDPDPTSSGTVACRHGRDPGGCPFCHARRTDPETSHEAATRAASFASTHAGTILAALVEFGPQTQTHLAGRVGLLPHQVNKRLADLKRRSLARPTGHTQTGHAGRAERVWEAINQGEET